MSLGIALVAAEYVARLALRDVRSSADERTYFARQAPPARRNRLGFREREPGPKTGYRIAVIGDSFTWGAGLQPGERFSELVDMALGDGYEVLNFGLPGRNLLGHLQTLERALSVSPDFVLLQLFINDWEIRGMVRPLPRPLIPWPSLERRLLRSSVLYSLIDLEWSRAQAASGMVESYPSYMDRYLRDPDSRVSRRTTRALRSFVARARAADARVGIVLFPSPGSLREGYPFEYLHDRVSAYCDQAQIPCLDLRRPFADHFPDPQAMWVSRFDHHPNAAANRRAAIAILGRFAPVWRRERARTTLSND